MKKETEGYISFISTNFFLLLTSFSSIFVVRFFFRTKHKTMCIQGELYPEKMSRKNRSRQKNYCWIDSWTLYELNEIRLSGLWFISRIHTFPFCYCHSENSQTQIPTNNIHIKLINHFFGWNSFLWKTLT